MAREEFEVADSLRNAVFEDLDFLWLQIADNLGMLVTRHHIDQNFCRPAPHGGILSADTNNKQEAKNTAHGRNNAGFNNGTFVVPLAFARRALGGSGGPALASSFMARPH